MRTGYISDQRRRVRTTAGKKVAIELDADGKPIKK
jgi:hypothetical protein